MPLPGKQRIESWILKLSILTSGVVLLLSIFNGYEFWMIILRTVLSFVLLYFLAKGLMILWDKISPPAPEKSNYGSTIDVIISDLNNRRVNTSHIEKSLQDQDDFNYEKNEESDQTPQKAYGGPMAGQINKDMQNGLQDAGAKAEIVRRMGWGEGE